ncbi:flavin reductase family protein [Nonomuraea cavernae]|uniref:Flavin reductase like domain-containing protein n=1 Tax=Nonomuraea cavernae TaxID=2045107 RepID=A0A918DHG8_9ACTN|nr:flavin reductase family protein [Nonomuraea cavernae]MCA2185574.1 flavin reductase family protein [Nonomuraea cavernae]GGO66879.1 hypothetical protein GCM10012289_21950 [Nonomuraea cavernae]
MIKIRPAAARVARPVARPVYVDRFSTTWPWLRSADHFAVNILASDQAELAARFARKDIDRFAEPTRWRPGPLGAPLLQDVSAHLVCLPDQTVDVGDHILVVGLVAEATVYTPGRPLLYHQGGFGRFVAHPRPPSLARPRDGSATVGGRGGSPH